MTQYKTVPVALLEQALEAVEAGPDVDPIFAGETVDALLAALAQEQTQLTIDRVALLRDMEAKIAALAQKQVEPLVWEPIWRLHELTQREYDELHEGCRWNYRRIAPPKAEPLTDEEIKDVLISVDPETKRLPPGLREFARAVERKVRGQE